VSTIGQSSILIGNIMGTLLVPPLGEFWFFVLMCIIAMTSAVVYLVFLKNHFSPSFLFVTPGIRMTDDIANDQVRTMTPVEAIKSGSSHLVIGRPITQSKDPSKTLEKIYLEINRS